VSVSDIDVAVKVVVNSDVIEETVRVVLVVRVVVNVMGAVESAVVVSLQVAHSEHPSHAHLRDHCWVFESHMPLHPAKVVPAVVLVEMSRHSRHPLQFCQPHFFNQVFVLDEHMLLQRELGGKEA
jgi:hypothetical protein